MLGMGSGGCCSPPSCSLQNKPKNVDFWADELRELVLLTALDPVWLAQAQAQEWWTLVGGEGLRGKCRGMRVPNPTCHPRNCSWRARPVGRQRWEGNRNALNAEKLEVR